MFSCKLNIWSLLHKKKMSLWATEAAPFLRQKGGCDLVKIKLKLPCVIFFFFIIIQHGAWSEQTLI